MGLEIGYSRARRKARCTPHRRAHPPIHVRTGSSSPSGSRGALLNFLRLRHSDSVTCDGPMARRHRVLGRLSEPHYQGNLSFATVSDDPRHRPDFFSASHGRYFPSAVLRHARRSEYPSTASITPSRHIRRTLPQEPRPRSAHPFAGSGREARGRDRSPGRGPRIRP